MLKKILEKYNNLSISVKASMCFLFCSVLQKGITVLVTPVFTRILTTEQYGEYSIYQSWASIFAVIATMRLSQAVYTQGLIKFKTDTDLFSSTIQGLSTTSIVAFFGVYLTFHEFFNDLTGLSTILMCAMFISMWVTESFVFWSMRQRVLYRYKTLIAITLLISVSKPIVAICAVLNVPNQNKVSARILTTVGIEILCYSIFNFIQWYKHRAFYSKKYWIYAVGFSIPLIPHYLSEVVLAQTDKIMIETLVGIDEAGIYSLAYSLSTLLTILNTAFLKTLTPWIYTNIKEKQFTIIGKNTSGIMLLVALANLVLIAFAPEAVLIFAPSEYQSALWVIPPLAMSVFFMFQSELFINFQFYYEKTKFVMMASIFTAALNIILNYIGINLFGYLAAGYTSLICYIIYAFVHYVFMKKSTKLLERDIKIYEGKNLIVISLLFILIGFMLMCLYNYFVLRLIVILCLILLALSQKNKLKALYITKN